jgi:hypothetical protein
MNAGPADTHSPHLDLADLIAGANGHPVSAPAREHLARCEQCRAEANRWDLVADGVRALAVSPPEAAPPGQAGPRRPRRPVLAGRWQRASLAAGSAAAAVLLLVAIGEATGFVHVSLSPGSGPAVALTAVGGCDSVEEATGTLVQTSGGGLAVKTASGQQVTLTTTASTFAAMSGALRGDISDGAPVRVTGYRSDGTIAALIVSTTPRGSLEQTHPSVPGGATIQGTVTDASAAGFTVVTSGGTRVPVTTSGYTTVNVLNISPDRLQAGALTVALGYIGPNGTLSVRAIVQPMVGVVQSPPGSQRHVSVSISSKAAHDCSPVDLAAGELNSAG